MPTPDLSALAAAPVVRSRRASRLWGGVTLVVVVAAVALRAHHVLRTFGGSTVDDAAISYAYAYNIALLRTSLARCWTRIPEAAPALCAAARALGLRSGALATLDCAQVATPRVTITRQDFEDPADPALHMSGAAGGWLAAAAGVAGGRGRLRLATAHATNDAAGELVWGPLPWPGRRFGVLLGGTGPGVLVVESRAGQGWSELARLRPIRPEVLQPQRLELPASARGEVRVRVRDESNAGGLVVDDLVFLGGDDVE